MCAPPIQTATVSDCLGRLCQGERGSDTQGRFEPQLVLYAYPISIASEHAVRVASVSFANEAERNRGKQSERDVARLRGYCCFLYSGSLQGSRNVLYLLGRELHTVRMRTECICYQLATPADTIIHMHWCH